jgi:hypothetical protein
MFNKKVCKKCLLSIDKRYGAEGDFEKEWKTGRTPCYYHRKIDKMPIDCPYVLEHAVSERQPQC